MSLVCIMYFTFLRSMWKVIHLFWKGQGAFQIFLKSFAVLKCGVSNGYTSVVLICEILEFFGKHLTTMLKALKTLVTICWKFKKLCNLQAQNKSDSAWQLVCERMVFHFLVLLSLDFYSMSLEIFENVKSFPIDICHMFALR